MGGADGELGEGEGGADGGWRRYVGTERVGKGKGQESGEEGGSEYKRRMEWQRAQKEKEGAEEEVEGGIKWEGRADAGGAKRSG